ncbi:MAG: hypothetical protein H6656_00400 [Ardenticatenaceae bacterium]|nr:hypothetical protein [Ardenticatenaceae bacterium]
MTGDLSYLFAQIPSAVNLRTKVLNDLGMHKSVVCYVSTKHILDSVQSFFAASLQHQSFYCSTVTLDFHTNDLDPISVIRRQLDLPAPLSPEPQSLEEFMQDHNLPDVIILNGISEMNCSTRQWWWNFVRQWAGKSHALISAEVIETPALLVLTTVESPNEILQGDTMLSSYWWWSIPSHLEARLICRLEHTNLPHLNERTDWREAILPSLVGGSLELAQYIWEYSDKSVEIIQERLREYAKSLGWTETNLRKAGIEQFLHNHWLRSNRREIRPNRSEQELWGMGVLSYTPEEGIWICSAALAIIDQVAILRHRLWRGQASLVLPVIDELRLKICQRFINLYGQSWHIEWTGSNSDSKSEPREDNPLATEWGHLENSLYRTPVRKEREMLPVVQTARRLRNTLAHYQLIDYEDYETLLNLINLHVKERQVS